MAYLKEHEKPLCFILGLLLLLTAALAVAGFTGGDLFSHSPVDSYTRQALAWREGRLDLPENIPELELAIYEGRVYVSFPPVPSLPMLLLSFVFGANTPNALMCLVYFLLAYAACFRLCARRMRGWEALAVAVFVALGGSVLDLVTSEGYFCGAVWYQAQLLGLALAMTAFYLADGESRAERALALIAIALAVGCRPFYALYAPYLVYILWKRLNRSVMRLLPYLIAPALIAAAYAAFNLARFGNPFEFGHAYLPEYTESGDAIFSVSRIGDNLRAILRPPHFEDGRLAFPKTLGFAVYLTNPFFIFCIARMIRTKRCDWLLCGLIVLNALLLLSHRTNGGWQYGTRYLCDLLPALVAVFASCKRRLHPLEWAPMAALVAFNLYGTVAFHM